MSATVGAYIAFGLKPVSYDEKNIIIVSNHITRHHNLPRDWTPCRLKKEKTFAGRDSIQGVGQSNATLEAYAEQ
jgi:hypothetical protein